MARTKDNGGIETIGEEGDENSALLSAAEDLISAVHSKSAEATASALRAAFDMLNSEPSKEDV